MGKKISLEKALTFWAHSIGVSHRSSFSDRLYFNETYLQDPSLDPEFARQIRKRCPRPGSSRDPTVLLDVHTPHRLDNKYYTVFKNHNGLLTSIKIF
ncbi:hypothetical protein CRYUN_Cryun08bG0002200 [Craigia yunnanensis]